MYDNNDYVEVKDIKIMQKLLYSILYDFHDICDKNDLIYNLYGGSLLGAVRHNAMIPWDDDIDVSMPRSDCYKLNELIKKQYSEKYTLRCPGDHNYIYPFFKLCFNGSVLKEHNLQDKFAYSAAYIDIFPLDGVYSLDPSYLSYNDALFFKLKEGRAYCVGKIEPSQTWWKKPYYIIRLIKAYRYKKKEYSYYLNLEMSNAMKYPFENYDYVYVAAGSWFSKGIIKKTHYLDRKLIKFGNIESWISKHYNEWLTKVYGDYNILPPVEKRTTPHNYTLKIKKEALNWL